MTGPSCHYVLFTEPGGTFLLWGQTGVTNFAYASSCTLLVYQSNWEYTFLSGVCNKEKKKNFVRYSKVLDTLDNCKYKSLFNTNIYVKRQKKRRKMLDRCERREKSQIFDLFDWIGSSHKSDFFTQKWPICLYHILFSGSFRCWGMVYWSSTTATICL